MTATVAPHTRPKGGMWGWPSLTVWGQTTWQLDHVNYVAQLIVNNTNLYSFLALCCLLAIFALRTSGGMGALFPFCWGIIVVCFPIERMLLLLAHIAQPRTLGCSDYPGTFSIRVRRGISPTFTFCIMILLVTCIWILNHLPSTSQYRHLVFIP